MHSYVRFCRFLPQRGFHTSPKTSTQAFLKSWPIGALDKTSPPIGHPVFDELHRPFVAQVVEETTDVGIKHPVHPLPLDAHRQRVQRLMRAATERLFLTEYASLPWTHQHAGLSRRSPSCP